MKRLTSVAAMLVLAGVAARGETLHYSINWPSGLSLGEATLSASDDGGALGLTIEAALPGFAIRDEYQSTVSAGYCSVSFTKQSMHGARKASERSEFDAARRIVTRKTNNGGESETAVPACARDALAFLFFTRQELKQGRLPGPQQVFFGAPYQVRMQYGGTEVVALGGQREECDRIMVTLKGPASEHNFELLFAKDAARTLVQVRAPFEMGTFRMELARE